MPLNVDNLPDKIFILGETGSDKKFSCSISTDNAQRQFLCVWTARDSVEKWVSIFKPGSKFSQLDRDTLVLVIVNHSACDYFVIDSEVSESDSGCDPFAEE